MSQRKLRPLARAEFIPLIACLIALDALSIDMMLPALTEIGTALNISRDNDRQFIITSLFSGFSLGLLAYGVLGDSLGRKRPILLGIVVFLIGTVLCLLADNLASMMFGRAIQGLGAAGPYVLSIAIIRDSYQGREMAKVLSLIMMIFVTLPAIAPILGQAILIASVWQGIFVVLGLFALSAGLWFLLRQPETLPEEKRITLSFREAGRAVKEVISHRVVMSFTLTKGCVFGAFLAFISTAQQVLQEQYELGEKFPFYFAALALTIGVAAFFNARWLQRIGVIRIALRSLVAMTATSFVFLPIEAFSSNGLPLSGFMTYMLIIYFCCGLLIGNITTLAMSPVGHIAGIASALIGSIGAIIAMILAIIIGRFYNQSVMPLIAGFTVLSTIALLLAYSVKQAAEESMTKGKEQES